MTQSPFFIVGTPQSGACLLELALSKYSQIGILPETAFFSLVKKSRPGQLRQWNQIEKSLGIQVTPPDHRIQAGACARTHFSRIVEAYLKRFDRSRITHIIEKTPEHLYGIREILMTYPDAKFILLYRDGRDVALSLTKTRQTPNDLYSNFYLWIHDYLIQRRFLQNESQRVMCVRYEDLISYPNQILPIVFNFLGLEQSQETSERRWSIDDTRRTCFKHNDMNSSTPGGDSIGKWRHELTKKTITWLEKSGGWALRELQYECITKRKHDLFSWYYPIMYGQLIGQIVKKRVLRTLDDQFGTTSTVSTKIISDFSEPEQPVPPAPAVTSWGHK